MRRTIAFLLTVFLVVGGIIAVTAVVQNGETQRTQVMSAADVEIARNIAGTRTVYSAQIHRVWRSDRTTSLAAVPISMAVER